MCPTLPPEGSSQHARSILQVQFQAVSLPLSGLTLLGMVYTAHGYSGFAVGSDLISNSYLAKRLEKSFQNCKTQADVACGGKG